MLKVFLSLLQLGLLTLSQMAAAACFEEFRPEPRVFFAPSDSGGISRLDGLIVIKGLSYEQELRLPSHSPFESQQDLKTAAYILSHLHSSLGDRVAAPGEGFLRAPRRSRDLSEGSRPNLARLKPSIGLETFMVHLQTSNKKFNAQPLAASFANLYRTQWISMVLAIQSSEVIFLPKDPREWTAVLRELGKSYSLQAFLNKPKERARGLAAFYRHFREKGFFLSSDFRQLKDIEAIFRAAFKAHNGGVDKESSDDKALLSFVLKEIFGFAGSIDEIDRDFKENPVFPISFSSSEKKDLDSHPAKAFDVFLTLIQRLWAVYVEKTKRSDFSRIDYSLISQLRFKPQHKLASSEFFTLASLEPKIFGRSLNLADPADKLAVQLMRAVESPPNKTLRPALVYLSDENFDPSADGVAFIRDLGFVLSRAEGFSNFLNNYDRDFPEKAKLLLEGEDPFVFLMGKGQQLSRKQYLAKAARLLAKANTSLPQIELDRLLDPLSHSFSPALAVLLCVRYVYPHSYVGTRQDFWKSLGLESPPHRHLVLGSISTTEPPGRPYPDLTEFLLKYISSSKSVGLVTEESLKKMITESGILTHLSVHRKVDVYNPFLRPTEVSKQTYTDISNLLLSFFTSQEVTARWDYQSLDEKIRGGFSSLMDHLSRLEADVEMTASYLAKHAPVELSFFKAILAAKLFTKIGDKYYLSQYLRFEIIPVKRSTPDKPFLAIYFGVDKVAEMTWRELEKICENEIPEILREARRAPGGSRVAAPLSAADDNDEVRASPSLIASSLPQSFFPLNTSLDLSHQMKYIFNMIGKEQVSFLRVRNFAREDAVVKTVNGDTLRISTILIAYAKELSAKEGREIKGAEALSIFAERELGKKIYTDNDLSYLLASRNLSELVGLFADQPELFFDALNLYGGDDTRDLQAVVENYADLRGAERPLGGVRQPQALRRDFVRVRLASSAENQMGEERFLIRLSRKEFDRQPQRLIATLEAEMAAISELDKVSEKVRDHYVSVYKKTIAYFRKAHNFAVLGLTTPLYPYQIEGVEFMTENKRVILADEAGLGKTRQAIGAVETLRRQGKIEGGVLWTSTLTNIPRTIREITANTDIPPEKILVVSGNATERNEQIRGYLENPENFAYVLTHYEGLRGLYTDDSGLYEDFSKSIAVSVVDESQFTDNEESLRSQAVLMDGPEYCFMLTATPYQSDSNRLFTLLNYLRPDKFRTKAEFERQFPKTAAGARKLVLETSDLILRRNKDETVTTLDPQRPALEQFADGGSKIPKHVERAPIFFELSQEQTLEIAEIRRNFRTWAEKINKKGLLNKPIDLDQVNTLNQMTWIRTVIYRPALLGLSDTPLRQMIDVLKVELLRLDKLRKKSLVWANNLDVIDLLAEMLSELNPVLLRGGESGDVVERFQKDPKVRLLIGNYQVSVGADISKAAEAFHVQSPSVYPLDYQVINRHHRILDPLYANDAHLEVGTTRIIPRYSAENLAAVQDSKLRSQMQSDGTIIEQDRRRIEAQKLFFSAWMSGYMQSSIEYSQFLNTQLLREVGEEAALP